MKEGPAPTGGRGSPPPGGLARRRVAVAVGAVQWVTLGGGSGEPDPSGGGRASPTLQVGAG